VSDRSEWMSGHRGLVLDATGSVAEGEVRALELAAGSPGAPLIVLVHGLEDSWDCWRPLARRFDGWRLVALDLPWRAGNDYRWRRTPAREWLARGLDLVDVAADVVVAHSFGAGATLDLLCDRDPRISRAALICPLYRPPRLVMTWRAFERAQRTFNRHIREGLVTRMGPRAAAVEPGVLDAMMDRAVDRVGPAGFLAVFEQFAATADLPLHAVRAPTLVLAGDADFTLVEGAAADLAAGIPNAVARPHPHYDHFCHLRHTDEVAAEIAGFAGRALVGHEPAFVPHPEEVPR
jgi:pimeloyl-ACP methyl ester carboxylesterase